MPIKRICLYQFPFTLVAAAVGLAILFRAFPIFRDRRTTPSRTLQVFLQHLAHLLTIVLIFVFKLGMLLSLGIAAS